MIEEIKQLLGFGPKMDYAELVKQGAIILDVRSKNEFEYGHIKGSINISLSQLGSKTDSWIGGRNSFMYGR